jgi:NAD(P)-dependent dehydrogenase (short-subunit alcohol dehydrogenase family)
MWDDTNCRATQARGGPIGEAKRKAVPTIPVVRTGRPEDVAGAAVFLASVTESRSPSRAWTSTAATGPADPDGRGGSRLVKPCT